MSLRQKIYEKLKLAIRSGQLTGGSRLLPSRVLAKTLGVSRNTLMGAVERLVADGYLTAKVGSGTFVKDTPPSIRHNPTTGTPRIVPSEKSRALERGALRFINARHCRKPLCSLSFDAKAFPYAEWQKALKKALSSEQSTLLEPADPCGYSPLRQLLLETISQARGVSAAPDQIFLFDGTQSVLSAIADILFDQGDAIAIGDPGFPGAYSAFESAGITIHAIPPFSAPKRTLGSAIKACFVTPTDQMPLGGAMSLAVRLSLLDWAVRARSWIIEDDFGCEFQYGRIVIPALQSLDRHGRVLHIGTFTNTLGPLQRLAYLVVPRSLIWAFRAIRVVTSKSGIEIGHVALAELFRSGRYGLHLRRRTAVYRANRNALLAELAALPSEVQITPSDCGLYICLRFGRQFAHDTEVVSAAQRQGICVRPLSMFSRNPSGRCNGVMVGFTGSDSGTTALAARELVSIIRTLSDCAAPKMCRDALAQ